MAGSSPAMATKVTSQNQGPLVLGGTEIPDYAPLHPGYSLFPLMRAEHPFDRPADAAIQFDPLRHRHLLPEEPVL